MLKHIESTPEAQWKTKLPFGFKNAAKIYGSPMFDKVGGSGVDAGPSDRPTGAHTAPRGRKAAPPSPRPTSPRFRRRAHYITAHVYIHVFIRVYMYVYVYMYMQPRPPPETLAHTPILHRDGTRAPARPPARLQQVWLNSCGGPGPGGGVDPMPEVLRHLKAVRPTWGRGAAGSAAAVAAGAAGDDAQAA